MQVETASGRIRGESRDGVLAFLGIPYAAPPLGPQRLRPPRPAEPWSGVRDARRPGPMALQGEGFFTRLFGVGAEDSSEDCLHLDVFTPGTAGRRPVLVYLHGGGFVTGWSDLPVYDGCALARRGDAVVVRINYRLGALGFLYCEELEQQNFALLDQLAALAWVREHAGAFGGDPERVTLFGQSAGAMCAATLLASPAAQGLFQRVILESGAARHVHAPETAREVRRVFCAHAGVAPDDVDALRELAPGRWLAAQGQTLEQLAGRMSEPPFLPVVDGAVLPRPPLEALAGGVARDVPLLVGTNRDEWSYYGLRDPRAALLDEAGLLRRFERGLPGRDAAGRPLAERVVESYREAYPDRNWTQLFFAIQTDRWFRVPGSRLAEAHARHQPETYEYSFEWTTPAFGGGLGACHGLEVPFVFGTYGHPAVKPLVEGGCDPETLSVRIQEAWLAFARGESPAAAGLPAWPRSRPGAAVMRLDTQPEGVDLFRGPERAFWDEIDEPSGIRAA